MIVTIVSIVSHDSFNLSKLIHGSPKFFYFCALAYFIFKLVRIYDSSDQRKQDYAPAAKTLTVFAAITIFLLLVTIFIACWCTHNFNQGLKPHVNKRSKNVDESNGKWALDEVPTKGGSVGNPGSSRMEID
jgi:hypothetical protein